MPKKYIKFTFKVEPDDIQFSRVFDLMGQTLDDLRPAFQDIAESFYVHMREVFAREGAVGTRSVWAPLSSGYGIWKRQRYPGRKILHLTGALERSLTEIGDRHGILNLRRLSMAIGTDLPYAKKHQTGIIEGNYILPQRKIIEITDSVKKEWTSIIHQYVYSNFKKAWKRLRPGEGTAA